MKKIYQTDKSNNILLYIVFYQEILQYIGGEGGILQYIYCSKSKKWGWQHPFDFIIVVAALPSTALKFSDPRRSVFRSAYDTLGMTDAHVRHGPQSASPKIRDTVYDTDGACGVRRAAHMETEKISSVRHGPRIGPSPDRVDRNT